MTEKQIKSYVLSLYKYKNISDKQFEKATFYLGKLRNSDLLFYYFNMGKLHTAFGDAKRAIFYLEKITQLNPDNSSAYYNLYKCYVKLNNIKMAQMSFEKFLEKNNKAVNFELVINIMNAINTIDRNFIEYLKEDFSVQYIPEYGYNDLNNNEELMDIYFDVIKNFNTRNYLMCIKKLELMNTKINDISYPMEVDTLIKLIKNLKNRETTNYIKCLEDDKYKGISNQSYTKILIHLYKLGCYSKNSLLNKVEKIILNDSYIKGDVILDNISGLKDFEQYQDMIEYLKGIIREKKAFYLLPEDKQKEFTEKRLVAKKQYINKENDICLESYLSLKEEYNLPICDYYIGKIMFRTGDFDKSKEYFLSYLKQGGIKTVKAYTFLAKIEKIKKNNSVFKSYIEMIHRVSDVFSREFEYLPGYQYKAKKNKKYVDSDISLNDTLKNKRMRTIKMKEEDFVKHDSLSTSKFTDSDIDEKLIIIRNLLRSGEIKRANKLLEKLEKECSSLEIPKIKQFQKNKKIYINQIRNN